MTKNYLIPCFLIVSFLILNCETDTNQQINTQTISLSQTISKTKPKTKLHKSRKGLLWKDLNGKISSRAIHVFVALCDNRYQMIAPVPEKIGNGDDPFNNLYWGAGYGVKTYFNKSKEWKLISTTKISDIILERLVYKHSRKNIYLIADAYRGKEIKKAMTDFIEGSSGNQMDILYVHSKNKKKIAIGIGGASRVLAYVGHNGFIEHNLDHTSLKRDNKERDVIVLCCSAKSSFGPRLKKAGAYPLLWTTNLMAPEAYTLKSALDGWLKGEKPKTIRMRAAKSYSKYQKCSLKASLSILVSGW